MGTILKRIGEFIYNAIVGVTEWLVDMFFALLGAALDTVQGLLPSLNIPGIEQLKPYFEVVNAWVPLDFAMTLLAAYLLIEMAVLIYRTIKKHIPTEA